MLVVCFCWILCLQAVIAQAQPRELDSLLQDYAFRALVRPRTGAVYDAEVPRNLSGVRVAALRLRSGSLRRRGVAEYKEFRIPIGVVEQPYVVRLVLVYQNLGNWSSLYYPLPGYTFLAPVLGLLAYDAANLSATNLPELDLRTSDDRISVAFRGVRSAIRGGSSPVCVYFGLDGSVGFDNVVGNDTCLISTQGHVSIVAVTAVAPARSPSPSSASAPAPVGIAGRGGNRRSKRPWVIAGSVIGGAALLVVLGLVFGSVRKCWRKKRMRGMESASELGVTLPMVRVGNTKAPVAMETRTRPMLENEFVP